MMLPAYYFHRRISVESKADRPGRFASWEAANHQGLGQVWLSGAGYGRAGV